MEYKTGLQQTDHSPVCSKNEIQIHVSPKSALRSSIFLLALQQVTHYQVIHRSFFHVFSVISKLRDLELTNFQAGNAPKSTAPSFHISKCIGPYTQPWYPSCVGTFSLPLGTIAAQTCDCTI